MRGFHFGIQHEGSIPAIAFLRSPARGFCLRRAVFVSRRRIFRCRKKNQKPGKLRLFRRNPQTTRRAPPPWSHNFRSDHRRSLLCRRRSIRRTMLPNNRRVRWLAASFLAQVLLPDWRSSEKQCSRRSSGLPHFKRIRVIPAAIYLARHQADAHPSGRTNCYNS